MANRVGDIAKTWKLMAKTNAIMNHVSNAIMHHVF